MNDCIRDRAAEFCRQASDRAGCRAHGVLSMVTNGFDNTGLDWDIVRITTQSRYVRVGCIAHTC